MIIYGSAIAEYLSQYCYSDNTIIDQEKTINQIQTGYFAALIFDEQNNCCHLIPRDATPGDHRQGRTEASTSLGRKKVTLTNEYLQTPLSQNKEQVAVNVTEAPVPISTESTLSQRTLEIKEDHSYYKPVVTDQTNTISQLEAELEKVKDLQTRMKKANRLAKQGDLAGIIKLGFNQNGVANALIQSGGFQTWKLKNNNQKIKQIEQKIAELVNA